MATSPSAPGPQPILRPRSVADQAGRSRALERGSSHRYGIGADQRQLIVLQQAGDGHVGEQVGEVLAQASVRPAAEAVQVAGLLGVGQVAIWIVPVRVAEQHWE